VRFIRDDGFTMRIQGASIGGLVSMVRELQRVIRYIIFAMVLCSVRGTLTLS
jgi:hypothetical protein